MFDLRFVPVKPAMTSLMNEGQLGKYIGMLEVNLESAVLIIAVSNFAPVTRRQSERDRSPTK